MVFVWTLSDLFGLFMLTVFLLVALVLWLWGVFHRLFCNHEKHDYYENRACDAICQGCGKNLGFIGTIREQRKPSSAINCNRE